MSHANDAIDPLPLLKSLWALAAASIHSKNYCGTSWVPNKGHKIHSCSYVPLFKVDVGLNFILTDSATLAEVLTDEVICRYTEI